MAKASPTISEAKRWTNSDDEVRKFCCLWTMNTFYWENWERDTLIRVLPPSAFSSRTNDNLEWRLELYPRGFEEFSWTYMSLRLTLVSRINRDKIRATFMLFILNNKSQRTNVIQGESYFTTKSSVAFGDFIERRVLLDESNGLISNYNLTLYCEVRVLDKLCKALLPDKSCEAFALVEPRTEINVPECTLLDEFEQLLDTKNLSDVTIIVDGQELHAHKCILAARSPVFSAMFEHEMKEKEQNLVEVTDMTHEVVGEMLRFIYTGRTPKLETLAVELLAAADKYALKRLKVLCEKYLATKLSADSAAEFLILADRHSADQLKSQIIEFISSHASEVIETSGFKTMTETHVHLITEVFKALATCRKS